ncbi:MAG: hypothetical protein ACRDIB_00665, partial [Ardenticatenaceae bacterium]
MGTWAIGTSLRSVVGEISGRRWFLVLTVGLAVFARVWDFGGMPPGLNQDEVSIGYEAFSLLHFGIERNGFSFPAHLVSWGSGQNVLYAYLAMPFVAWGLTPVTVRMAMLIVGLLTLPLVYRAT